MSDRHLRAGLLPVDALRLASYGLRVRPMRAVLAGLGIAIGIAAMVAVVGISASSRAELHGQLDALGTNLLTASPGRSFFGAESRLPEEAPAMLRRIPAVQTVTGIGQLPGVRVYRNDMIPSAQSGGIGAYAVHVDLLDTLGGGVASGTWLNEATARYPTTVLGARAAQRLGIGPLHTNMQIWLGGRWFTVIGVLDPLPLAPGLDTGVFVGWKAAEQYLDFDGGMTTLFVRADQHAVEGVRGVLARTVNPAAPNEVDVSRPSDVLAAAAAADAAFTGLLLGLGAVALLVGGIGVANTMVIAVLERRAEIGLRRALGATRGHIRVQFLGEALILAVGGGAAGTALGVVVTAAYAALQHWPVAVPLWVVGGSLVATAVIGVLAGLYPALRAAEVAPTEALASSFS